MEGREDSESGGFAAARLMDIVLLKKQLALPFRAWQCDSIMALPDFDENDDLPPGIHRAILPEVLTRFGSGSPQRCLVARRLERVFALVRSTGKVARFVVFGSFVTKKPNPADVDIFMLMDDTFDVRSVEGEAGVLFDHTSAQNYEGASIFWIRRMAALGGEEAAVAHWQIKRDGTHRGIVEVVTDDS